MTLTDWLCGGVRANLMFGLPALQVASKPRWGAGLWIGEVVATFGLVLVIFGVVRARRASAAPLVVGANIAAAYWFTSSTSLANPAVTLARTLSDTFAGIAPASVLPFLGVQLVGALLGMATIRFLYPDVGEVADQVVVPHQVEETS
jgi:glycerol uptake facilitator-like aquaporin